MTPVEIIALIVVIASVVKMLVLLIQPRAWMNLAKGVYKSPALAQVVAFILAAIVFFYLIQEITIIQIMAVVAFTALLIVLGLAPEIDQIIKKYDVMIKKGALWKQYWFYTLIWLILIIWAAKELLM